MKKIEVLSPAGDVECFYKAIESGADAVYFGLNKFNARMKAGNFSLENLADIVKFAHLKQVKVYVTVNTLVSNSEMPAVVEMVSKAWQCGVDAFIVQDFGVIFALKKAIPDIVLHGSTQMGVHNVHGARVAKRLGLSRVVLSREATISDIADISKNVDIELEAFVQGANCVCFSGNCYLSSLKFGASGNRGECKQLCRLDYTLSDGNKSKYGYMISPRDNCMAGVLEKLIGAGVMSLKIEGRLRRPGYVAVATSVYRNLVDKLQNDKKHQASNDLSKDDIADAEQKLTKVFSRGKFTRGYNDGGDIIEPRFNAHTGEIIGKVVGCSRFKDLYKIEIKTDEILSEGDGLKFIDKNSVVSLGVGNTIVSDKNTIVFGKNSVNIGATVYRTLDSKFENNVADYSRYRDLKLHAEFAVGSPAKLTVTSGKYMVVVTGEQCCPAKSKPLTEGDIKTQLSKIGDYKKFYKITEISANILGDVFLPLGAINAIRNKALETITSKISDSLNPSKTSESVCKNVPQGQDAFTQDKIFIEKNQSTMSTDFENWRIAMVDENCDVQKIKKSYDALILSPSVFGLKTILSFQAKYESIFTTPLILNLPMVARLDDIKIIDNILKDLKTKNVILLANNVYALDYIGMGLPVWAGSDLNVTNDYAISGLKNLGVQAVVGSIEKWCMGLKGILTMAGGKRVLMTFAHCPAVTLHGGTCPKDNCSSEARNFCKYVGGMRLSRPDCDYTIRRVKIKNCYFELVDSVRVPNAISPQKIDDLRE